MSIPSFLLAAEGRWNGLSRLYLPGDPIRESASQVQVARVAKGKFLTLSYDWVFEGEPQAGLLLLGIEKKGGPAVASFIDSWHMGDKLMVCRGTATPAMITVRGQYSVEGYPDWGWRIDIELDSELRVVMYNVSPEDVEELGFELLYAARVR